MTGLPCPTCGAELTFLEQYQRHFCYHCQQYAPEGYGAKGENKCLTCGGILSYIVQYDRFYCYRCNTYPPGEPTPAPSADLVPEKPLETTVALVSTEPSTISPGAETPATPSTPPLAVKEPEPVQEKPAEEPAPAAKPPLIREEILEAKKPVLMDLCKAYDLDPSGTKEQIRERLLSYLEELEGEERPEEESVPEALAEEVPATAVPEVIVREEPVAESKATAPVSAVVIQEEAPAKEEAPAEAKVEVVPETKPQAAPQPEPVRETPPVIVEAPKPAPSPPPRVEHPCPACGRELEYISQYDRWYCYSCKAYAPALSAKHACPNCGATMRWVERYARWWCDSCREYAPADLPAPRATVGEIAAAQPAAQVATLTEAKPAIVVHRHHNPASGIGLAGLGLVMWVIYEVVVEVPRFFPVDLGITLQREYAFLLQFLGLLFVGVGVLVGLAALKDRT